jgi:hypothetical protein
MQVSDVKRKETKNSLSAADASKVLFEWKFQKKSQVNKGLLIGVFIFLFAAMGLLLWQENYFGSFVILMIVFLIFMLQSGEEEVNYAILKRGIKIKKEIFPWKNLESFWVFEEIPEIYVKTKKAFISHISLQIKKEDGGKIRNILLEFLPEKETQLPLSELIFKRLGF